MTTNQDMEKFKKSTNLEFRKGKWWYVSPQKYRRSVEATIKKNKERMYVGGKYINRDNPYWVAGRYKSWDDVGMTLGVPNYTTKYVGDVYIISNPAWEGWYKIGSAIDTEDRYYRFQTYSPKRDYVVEFKKKFQNRNKAERNAHKILKIKACQHSSEWFKIDLDDAINIIENIEEGKLDEANT